MKIEEFQKKGAINNFSEILKSLGDISNNCIMLIDDAQSVLKQEQQEDEMLRAQNGAKWSMPTSAAINQPYMANLTMYCDKLAAAKKKDQAMSESFD